LWRCNPAGDDNGGLALSPCHRGQRSLDPMRIQQVAVITGASQKAIRHYEALGLLGPVPRRGAYRTYSADHVALVALVRRAQRFGFTLAELRAAQRGGQVEWVAVQRLVQGRREALRAERERLQRLEHELDAIAAELAPCAAAAIAPSARDAACLDAASAQLSADA
jgi:DNA-binding transcriptional MerR regulator